MTRYFTGKLHSNNIKKKKTTDSLGLRKTHTKIKTILVLLTTQALRIGKFLALVSICHNENSNKWLMRMLIDIITLISKTDIFLNS